MASVWKIRAIQPQGNNQFLQLGGTLTPTEGRLSSHPDVDTDAWPAPGSTGLTCFSSLLSIEAALHRERWMGKPALTTRPPLPAQMLCAQPLSVNRTTVLWGTKALTPLDDFKEGFALVLLA